LQLLRFFFFFFFPAIKSTISIFFFFFSNPTQVLRRACDTASLENRVGLEWMQECMVMGYVASLASRAEALGEERFSSLARDLDLAQLVCRVVDAHGGEMKEFVLLQAARAVAGILSTDDAQGFRERYFPDRAGRSALVAAHTRHWRAMSRETLELRRELQPLIDAFRDYEDGDSD
jgi:hypothetical protein